MLRYFLPLLGAVAMLSGCATDRTAGAAPTIELTELEELPAPVSTRSGLVQPGDILEIVVRESETLSGKFFVDERGTIDFPLIGEVEAAGASPSVVADRIAARLRDGYVLDPNVRVVPDEDALPTVSVGGEVEKPGAYPARQSQTLLRAVNNAGGLSEYAKVDDVLVLRTVAGQRYIGVYNIRAIQRGNYEDPEIYADDVITVGDSPARRRIASLLPLVPLLSTTAILIDRIGGN